jgi:hypothetical protein
MALLIQLGITDVSLLTGYPKTTHPKCMVVCIHLYAHTARLVLATVDFVEELQVVLHQTGIIIGQEYQGLNLETSLKTKAHLAILKEFIIRNHIAATMAAEINQQRQDEE